MIYFKALIFKFLISKILRIVNILPLFEFSDIFVLLKVSNEIKKNNAYNFMTRIEIYVSVCSPATVTPLSNAH